MRLSGIIKTNVRARCLTWQTNPASTCGAASFPGSIRADLTCRCPSSESLDGKKQVPGGSLVDTGGFSLRHRHRTRQRVAFFCFPEVEESCHGSFAC